jgi:hypothetical protein
MPNTQRPSGTGSAPIKKQGHTTDGNYGSDPNFKGKGQRPPRDLSVKGGSK